jgi:hypothetical protein
MVNYLKYLKPLFIFGFVLGIAFLIYSNFSKITTWFKSIFTDINPTDTVKQGDLFNPNYVIHDKIITNYVDQIVTAVDRWGTDEMSLQKVFEALKNDSLDNTVKVWNEYKNRGYLYSPSLGQYVRGLTTFTGAMPYNLFELLKFELQDSQSEKNVLVNWTWQLKRAGLIAG